MKHFSYKFIPIFLCIILFSFPYQTVEGHNLKQDQIYSEDFEDSQAQGWDLESGWKIIEEGDNKVLSGSGHFWARANQDRTDFHLSFRLKLLKGRIHLVFRNSNTGRYYIGFEKNLSDLSKQYWPNTFQENLDKKTAEHKLETWHQVEIDAKGSEITLKVDNKSEWVYTDPDPLLSGDFGFETLDSSEAEIDDIKVEVTSSDVQDIKPTPTIQISPQKKEEINKTNSSYSTQTWIQTNGPEGGLINAIEIDPTAPDTLYSGGAGGIYKTTNAGQQWTQMSGFSASYGEVRNLILDPKEPNILYALAAQFYKSTDGGSSWLVSNSGNSIICAAIDPSNPDRLILGTNEGGVLLSENKGSSWKDISSNLPTIRIKAVAFGSGDVLWVGTGDIKYAGNGFLYKTDNKGKNWNKVDLNQAESSDIHSIFVDPRDKKIVYVGLHDVNNEMFSPRSDTYLVKTIDNGSNWQKLNLPFTDAMVNLMQSGTITSTIFLATGGRAFYSKDGGKDWVDFSPPGRNGDMYDVALDPRNENILFLPRRAYGIAKSTDSGKTWAPINSGLINTTISLLALGDSEGKTIYASSPNGEGTYKSTDFGEHWINVTSGGITHPWADELAVSPIDNNNVWEIADVGQVFVSSDGGIKWTKTIDSYGNGFRGGTITSAAISPSNSNIIYGLKSGFGIFKSINGGSTWKFLHSSEVDYSYSLAVNPTDANVIFSGDIPKPFQKRARVQRSMDGGEIWQTVLTVPDSSGVTSVAIDSQNPQNIYAASTGNSTNGGGQIYFSNNNGDSWSKLNPHFTMLTVWGQPQLIGDPGNNSVVYAGTWLAGTWKTTDAGKNWTKLENAPLSSTSLMLDPNDPKMIYATDRTKPKLWKSEDAGNNWEIIADFSGDGAFLLNRVMVGKDTIYVSTFGPGIHDGRLYRSQNKGVTWTNITNDLPRSVLDIAIDPKNPSNLYVTTHIFGAYYSTDGGDNWLKINQFPDIGAYDIEVDPVSPNILFAAGLGGSVPDWVYPGGYSFKNSAGIYKSSDYGKTWRQVLKTSNECRAVRIHPSDSNIVLASSLSDGFFISLDGGESWVNQNEGLDSKNLTSVWVNADKVFVGTQGFGV